VTGQRARLHNSDSSRFERVAALRLDGQQPVRIAESLGCDFEHAVLDKTRAATVAIPSREPATTTAIDNLLSFTIDLPSLKVSTETLCR